jgi:hypothetical protein
MATVSWAYIHDEPRDIASASLNRAGHEEHQSHYHHEHERPQPELPFSDITTTRANHWNTPGWGYLIASMELSFSQSQKSRNLGVDKPDLISIVVPVVELDLLLS